MRRRCGTESRSSEPVTGDIFRTVTTEPLAVSAPPRENVRAVAAPLICVIAALLVTGLLLALLGADPIFAYKTLVLGGIGSPQALSDTIAKTIPIALIAFGVMLTFRCGLWNIGGEGQFYSGAIAAAITGIVVDAPAALLIPLEIASWRHCRLRYRLRAGGP